MNDRDRTDLASSARMEPAADEPLRRDSRIRSQNLVSACREEERSDWHVACSGVTHTTLRRTVANFERYRKVIPSMKLLSGLSVLSLGLSLFFQPATADAAGLSASVMVTEIRTFNVDGGAVVKVDGNLLTSCSAKNYFRVTNQTVVRGIQASYLAGRPIRVVTTDSCANIYDNASEVYF